MFFFNWLPDNRCDVRGGPSAATVDGAAPPLGAGVQAHDRSPGTLLLFSSWYNIRGIYYGYAFRSFPPRPHIAYKFFPLTILYATGEAKRLMERD